MLERYDIDLPRKLRSSNVAL